MAKLLALTLLSLTIMLPSQAQDLPLREIPAAPANYSAGNVMARMVEGFGFRYYWASEGLRPQDLKYKPSEDSRNCEETLNHILNLAEGIYFTSNGEGITNTRDFEELGYEEVRKMTLEKLAAAAKNFRSKSDKELAEMKIRFGKNGGKGFDLWYLINGQIADGIYHTGQVVTFRRSSGNPINPKISVFRGTVRK